MLTLLGVGVVVLGFCLRLQPASGDRGRRVRDGMGAGHMTLLETISALGKAFNQSRLVSIALLVLPGDRVA